MAERLVCNEEAPCSNHGGYIVTQLAGEVLKAGHWFCKPEIAGSIPATGFLHSF